MVIASHQKSGLSEFVLGSVAAHCTTHSSQPVLVLHAPHAAPASPGLLDRLAAAAASALGGNGQQEAQAGSAEQSGGGATAVEPSEASVDSGCACRLRRNIVVAVDDSGAVNGLWLAGKGRLCIASRLGPHAASLPSSCKRALPCPSAEASERACSWALHHLHRPGDTFHLLRIIPTLPFRWASWQRTAQERVPAAQAGFYQSSWDNAPATT